MLLSSVVMAQNMGTGLEPYSVTYKTKARGLTMILERSLSITDDGHFNLANSGKVLLAGFVETSLFDLIGSTIVPKRYVYRGTGLIQRKRELIFLPSEGKVESLKDATWHSVDIGPNTYDRVSQLEQLRLNLLNGAEPTQDFSVEIIDGNRVKRYTFKFTGYEQLDTPLGTINTLQYTRGGEDNERESKIWLAPDWQYLMVKTTHLENDTIVEAMIQSGSIADELIAVTPAAE
ncbi:MAG TPA: DUF3108 domain-containing protein [Halieaceae bacterium]|nr:DUF3108 domain-containing protein [Halieaceae bacterium]